MAEEQPALLFEDMPPVRLPDPVPDPVDPDTEAYRPTDLFRFSMTAAEVAECAAGILPQRIRRVCFAAVPCINGDLAGGFKMADALADGTIDQVIADADAAAECWTLTDYGQQLADYLALVRPDLVQDVRNRYRLRAEPSGPILATPNEVGHSDQTGLVE